MDDWIEARGLELVVKHGSMRDALHALIAEHEEPPVDPLVAEAEALAQQHMSWNNSFQREQADRLALACLKRGIELASKP